MSVAELNEQSLRQFVREELDRSALAVRVRQLQGEAAVTVHTPSFTNGWADIGGSFHPTRVYKEGSRITIVGLLNGLSATNVQAFVLPTGWRPAAGAYHSFAGVSYYNGTTRLLGLCYVTDAGAVLLYGQGDVLVARDYYSVNLVFYTHL